MHKVALSICAIFASVTSVVANAEDRFDFVKGAYTCVGNGLERFEGAHNPFLPKGLAFNIVLERSARNLAITVGVIPLDGFPSSEVRLENIKIVQVAVPTHSTCRAISKPSCFAFYIRGSGNDSTGKILSFSDIWVGNERMITQIKPRIAFDGKTTPVICTSQAQGNNS